ncbi:MAG: PHP domain-containing protein [Clostridiales bacterium]|nr:PHP domain-containing protein [Clostridiales bacterium]
MDAKFIEGLNAPTAEERLQALEILLENQTESDKPVVRENDANNHIHTIYSFSPYSPTKAAYMAYIAGLTSAGIMDHDSLSGAIEFKKACEMLGLGHTCGVEVRAKFDRGFGRINHPDQNDCIYMAAHGIPEQNLEAFNEYLSSFRIKRNLRDQKMCKAISDKYGKFGIELDFKKDVLPLAQAEFGGSITERHLLYALANKLEKKFGRTDDLLNFLESLGLKVSEKIKAFLLDQNNDKFLYDLLGVLKADTKFFYIDADEEMPEAEDFVKKAIEFGAIPAYAYLGDVGESVTGDKKAQTFEDAYLPELLKEIKKIGIKAVAYMPTRNTPAQLERLGKLCKENDLFEISGEDVNSPRQKFECAALANPQFSHLIDATWALIGHEAISTKHGVEAGMFSKTTMQKTPNLLERIAIYSEIGRNTVKK